MNDQVKMSGSHTGLCPVRSQCTGQARPGLHLSRPSPFFASVWRLFPIVQSGVTTFRLSSPDQTTNQVFYHYDTDLNFCPDKEVLSNLRSPLQTTMFEREFKELIRNSLVRILNVKDSSSPSVSNKSLCFVSAYCRCLQRPRIVQDH